MKANNWYTQQLLLDGYTDMFKLMARVSAGLLETSTSMAAFPVVSKILSPFGEFTFSAPWSPTTARHRRPSGS